MTLALLLLPHVKLLPPLSILKLLLIFPPISLILDQRISLSRCVDVNARLLYLRAHVVFRLTAGPKERAAFAENSSRDRM